MRRLPLVLIAVLFLGFGAAWANAATVGLNLNHNNFGKGDGLVVSVSGTNTGTPVLVDAYLVVAFPDGSLFFYGEDKAFHAGTADPATWTKFISSFSVPGSFDSGPIPILAYTLTGTEPPGTYEWLFGITEAGTSNILDVKAAPFFVSPGQVGTLIGTYNVTTSIPSLGASGTGTLNVVDSSPGMLTISASQNSAGFTASFTGTGQLNAQGGISMTMQADIFGTQVQGSGFIDADGNISGTINVLAAGPFIRSITNISGKVSNGIINTTENVQYTDGRSGTEYLTAVRQ